MRYLRLAAGTDGISRFSEQTPELAAGDLVLTLGAGDVWKVADELVARMA